MELLPKLLTELILVSSRWCDLPPPPTFVLTIKKRLSALAQNKKLLPECSAYSYFSFLITKRQLELCESQWGFFQDFIAFVHALLFTWSMWTKYSESSVKKGSDFEQLYFSRNDTSSLWHLYSEGDGNNCKLEVMLRVKQTADDRVFLFVCLMLDSSEESIGLHGHETLLGDSSVRAMHNRVWQKKSKLSTGNLKWEKRFCMAVWS